MTFLPFTNNNNNNCFISQEHCLVSTEGEWNNVLKIKPPMVFTKDNVDTICALLDSFLAELERGALSQRRSTALESAKVSFVFTLMNNTEF